MHVMLDMDLAMLYQVETKALKQAVKRNIERFPDDIMFELSSDEFKLGRYAPMAFTEQGVAVLASVYRSKRVIQVNDRPDCQRRTDQRKEGCFTWR